METRIAKIRIGDKVKNVKVGTKEKPLRDGHWAKIKEERFELTGGRRLEAVLKALDSLGKVSDRTNYKYDQTQAKEMMREIEVKLASLKEKFEPKQQGRPFV